jgi:methylmalonyl-CoA mutase cobalamin-binding subunit
MDATLSQRPLMMSIAAVERDTGLSKDTLRVWERRYEFPQPVRDPQGERCYPLDQIEKLRLIKRLLDVGHRPSRLVGLPMDDLQALSERSADAQGLTGPTRRRINKSPMSVEVDDAPRNGRAHLLSFDSVPAWSEQQNLSSQTYPWVDLCLAHVDKHDPLALRAELSRGLLQLGLSRFIAELATPLLTAIGNGWLRGRFQIFQEHWVSHYLQQALHGAIQSFPVQQGTASPRVLLSTLPGEHHSLGLLMVESWLCLEEALPINLGPQTPLWDLVHAAQSCQSDVVALSFSPHAAPQLVQDGLTDLRAKLPSRIELWAGGSHPILQRKPPEGVVVLNDMSSLSSAVAVWRARHASTNPR